MSNPNETPSRGEWACPCSGCQKAVGWERKQIIQHLIDYKKQYIQDRGGSFNEDGSLYWAKDDAMSYVEGIEYVIELIEERTPKPKKKA
jgi:hypothetical protein